MSRPLVKAARTQGDSSDWDAPEHSAHSRLQESGTNEGVVEQFSGQEWTWCPGAESNHRHRDFQSGSSPRESWEFAEILRLFMAL
jgi:TFIIF-interacting CTD phosphatase-like protein